MSYDDMICEIEEMGFEVNAGYDSVSIVGYSPAYGIPVSIDIPVYDDGSYADGGHWADCVREFLDSWDKDECALSQSNYDDIRYDLEDLGDRLGDIITTLRA